MSVFNEERCFDRKSDWLWSWFVLFNPHNNSSLHFWVNCTSWVKKTDTRRGSELTRRRCSSSSAPSCFRLGALSSATLEPWIIIYLMLSHHQSKNLMFRFMTRKCLQKQLLMSQNRPKMAKEDELGGSVGWESHVHLPLLPFPLHLSPTFLSSSLSLFSFLYPSLSPTVSLSQVLFTALVYMASFLLVNKLLASILNGSSSTL